MPRDNGAIVALIDRAAEVFDVTLAELTGTSRERHAVQARQAAMLALRQQTTLSLVVIGRLIGGRHHSTVLSGIAAAEALAAHDPRFRERVQLLCRGEVPRA